MNNVPEIKLGLVVGTTNWMPTEYATESLHKLADIYRERYGNENIFVCPVCVDDNEVSVKRALKSLEKNGCNALCLYFANYGPEKTCAVLVEKFTSQNGPVMFCAAAEEAQEHLWDKRKDAYSGILNANYGLSWKNLLVYLPNEPVSEISECANMVHNFVAIARVIVALRYLQIISFGPRPSSYTAAYAPYHSLYNWGIKVDEFSEMELLNAYERHIDDSRIPNLVEEMLVDLDVNREVANLKLLGKFAQYELTVKDWLRNHKGLCEYVALTSTCWPAFPKNFGFVPCYVNSRLAGQGIPCACEVDIFGALSEYVAQCVSNYTATILNINNNIPKNIYESKIKGLHFLEGGYEITDLFLGYHCGVTSNDILQNGSLKPHFINNKLIGYEMAQGTIQGGLKPGLITIFRIQVSSNGKLSAYMAEGEILPINIDTYGGRAVIAVKEMSRFYRYVLLTRHFPNHFALLYGHFANELYSICKYLGIDMIEYNHPPHIPYKDECMVGWHR